MAWSFRLCQCSLLTARAAQYFCALTWKPEAYSSVLTATGPLLWCAPPRCRRCRMVRQHCHRPRTSKAVRPCDGVRGARTVCSERGLSHWSSFLPWPIPSTHSVPSSTNSAQPSHAKAEAAVGRWTHWSKIQNFVQKLLGLFPSCICETCKYGHLWQSNTCPLGNVRFCLWQPFGMTKNLERQYCFLIFGRISNLVYGAAEGRCCACAAARGLWPFSLCVDIQRVRNGAQCDQIMFRLVYHH